jgi:UDP-3-O-[3-hydroxymyristoyl] N-acetylglucosamine deacetylase
LLTVNPAPENYGIVFRRKDISDFNNYIKADYKNVCKTQLGTSIANSDGTIVSTVEHLMAALWGCGIDNALIDVNSAEIPIMDGSSAPFVKMLESVGVSRQNDMREFIQILSDVRVEDGDKYASVSPSDDFSIDLEIDFASGAIKNQKRKFSASTETFNSILADARTFGFEHEVEYMRSIGLARGGSLDNAVVVSGDKILNKEGLRYEDEFVRHKLLDCVGDFFLAGKRIVGNFKAYKSGHGLNNKLLHEMFANPKSYKIVK